jgi:hypothetical protein
VLEPQIQIAADDNEISCGRDEDAVFTLVYALEKNPKGLRNALIVVAI